MGRYNLITQYSLMFHPVILYNILNVLINYGTNRGDTMTVTTFWIKQEKSIVRINLKGHWQYEDLMRAIGDMKADIQRLPAPVHIVIEFDSGRRVPRSILSMLAYALQQLPDNIGTVTVVTNGNPLMNAILKMADRLYPFVSGKLQLADSYDEAYQRVHQYPLGGMLRPSA